jgi:hypothetical protein
VADKLIKGGPTTEHEGEENFNMHLVHGTDNEAEMDVEFITDGSYNNWECQNIAYLDVPEKYK